MIMMINAFIKLIVTSSLLFIIFTFHGSLTSIRFFKNAMVLASTSSTHSSMIHIAAVVCKDEARIAETVVNFKSILFFTQRDVTFHIFTEDGFTQNFTDRLALLQQSTNKMFKYEIHPIQYPDDGYTARWKKLFKPCASLRLFIPDILENIDSLLYVDTDVLFLSPVEHLWDKLKKFNDTHVAALAAEHVQSNSAWYPRFGRHPYYGLTGLNSGVMLMNLTRIRGSKFKNDVASHPMDWHQMLLPLYQKYHYNITWGDQDLLNIIFHYNPEMVMELSCDWNYRPDHCMYMPLCKQAIQTGVQILHGCRGAFHTAKWPIFRTLYDGMESCQMNDFQSCILKIINEELEMDPKSSCSSSAQTIVKLLTNQNQHNEL